MPGPKDLANRERSCQKPISSGPSRSKLNPSNAASSANIAMPAEKHQVATERRLRTTTATAKVALKKAAANAKSEFEFTISLFFGSDPREGTPHRARRRQA